MPETTNVDYSLALQPGRDARLQPRVHSRHRDVPALWFALARVGRQPHRKQRAAIRGRQVLEPRFEHQLDEDHGVGRALLDGIGQRGPERATQIGRQRPERGLPGQRTPGRAPRSRRRPR